MKFNISYPTTGGQKTIDIDDEHRCRPFYDHRISQEVPGDSLGDDFKGYIFRITGGNDKQGFAMKQGILIPGRTRLLLIKGATCYRPRRTGERKRKSVRGCIVQSDIAVLNLVVVKKGDKELPGVTDTPRPRRLGPKRASRIRKLFNLSKEDDVRKYVVRREITTTKKGTKAVKDGKKPQSKAPKIQRLVTPVVLQRKRYRLALKKKQQTKAKSDAEAYAELLRNRIAEAKSKRQASIAKKRQVKPAAK